MQASNKHLLLDYGRRTYVFGLSWFTSDEDEPLKKSALETAKNSQAGFDLLLLRPGDSPQYALSSKSEGVKSGAISAAAALTTVIGGEGWLYALEIQGLVWISNGKNSYIMPNGDRVFEDENEAKEAFLKLEPNKWKSLHVPKSWKEDGAFSDDRIKNLLQSEEVLVSSPDDIFAAPTSRWMRTSAISGTNNVAKLALGVIALGALGYFGNGLLFPKDITGDLQAAEQRRALLAARAKRNQEIKFEEFDAKRPWNSSPRASDLISACNKTIAQIPTEAAGYTTALVECDGETVRAELDKSPETYANWLMEWSKTNTQYDLDLTNDGSIAYLLKDIDAPQARKTEQLGNYSYSTSVLKEAASIDGASLSVSEPVVYTYDEYPDYVPLYGTANLLVSTRRPDAWLSVFDDIGGVELDTISYFVKEEIYQFKGSIYVSNR